MSNLPHELTPIKRVDESLYLKYVIVGGGLAPQIFQSL